MNLKQGKTVTSLETEYMAKQEVVARAAAKRRKLLIRRLSAFFILAVAVSSMLIYSFVSKESALKEKKAEKVQLEENLANLEKKQYRLENEIEKLNDDEYIAKLARSEYFLSDKGEIIFNLPKKNGKKED